MRTLQRHHRSGFSLVEIVLALGLTSIGLLSILGLLGTSMQTSRHAQNDALLVAMSTQVLAQLRAMPFDALVLQNPEDANGEDDFDPLPDVLPDSVLYFNGQGERVPAALTGANPEAVYECRVKKTPNPAMRGVSGGVHHQVQLELYFSWPVDAHTDPKKRPGQSREYASVARYQ